MKARSGIYLGLTHIRIKALLRPTFHRKNGPNVESAFVILESR